MFEWAIGLHMGFLPLPEYVEIGVKIMLVLKDDVVNIPTRTCSWSH